MRKTINKTWKGRTFGLALGIILFALVLLADGAGAATPINSCVTISSPGTYVLNQNIINNTNSTCISIVSKDIIFDGAYHMIDGINRPNSYGVRVYNTKAVLSNVTVKNLIVTDWSQGISFSGTTNGRAENNSASSNMGAGISLYYSNSSNVTNNSANSNTGTGVLLLSSSNNTIAKNNANSNIGIGISLLNSSNLNTLTTNIASTNNYGLILFFSSNNIIYNNFFNNTNNSGIISSINRWNTTKTLGINIIGDPYLGGNVWANPNGTGFSQTCTDTDSDGICDSNYTITSKNVDYLPLEYENYWTVTPPAVIGFTPNSSVSDISGAIRFFNITLNQTVNVTWYINGTQIQFNKSVTSTNYTNTSAVAGIWNVTAIASNNNGTVSQTWNWNVTKAPATVTLTNLTQIYTGSPLTPTATTNPSGLNIVWSGAPQTAAGSYPVTATINDNNYTGSNSSTFNITKASTSTAINSSANSSIFGNVVTFTATVSSAGGAIPDGETVAFYDGSTEIGSNMTLSGNATFSISTLTVGLHTINATYAGDTNFSTSTGSVMQTVNPAASSAPSITSAAPASPVTTTAKASQTFSITINQTVNVTWLINGTVVQDTEKNVVTASYTNTSATAGFWNITAIATNVNGTVSQSWTWTVTEVKLPPDPSTVAPPVDQSVATNIATSTAFLYTGSNPIQTGVAPGTIEAKRAAVLRGRVLNRDGTNLSGVNISILSHPEFGSTFSRADGMFDMAVNGGGLLTVNYEKPGYFTVQRQVNAPWQDYAWLPDVVMIQPDSNVTVIDFSSSAPIQVARGSVVNDSDGTRQATLLFSQGTQANMTLPNGTVQNLTMMHVRATEYTVGASGLKAMPAELPPTSGYTYAVEFSADEAVAAGATDVVFDRTVYSYVENFLNFPVGGIVPVGYYDKQKAAWVPDDNGLVIKILSITNGMADLDVNGSGLPANATTLSSLDFTDAERQQLANLYTVGQSLWRVPITHFRDPDYNWPFGKPPGAQQPNLQEPEIQTQNPPNIEDKPCKQPGGSIIGCENQELGEAVDIAGTQFSLHYQSGRVLGHDNTLNIPLSGASVPTNLTRIDLYILVAGRYFTQSFPAAPNQSTIFTWDGKNAYGTTLQGAQPVTVRIGYVYNAFYMTPPQLLHAFGVFGGNQIMNCRALQEVALWQVWKGSIGSWDARAQGLGGWSLNVHHTYDPYGRILYLGDGGRRSTEAMDSVITTVAGTGCGFYGCYGGDGGPATQAGLSLTTGIGMGQDGSIYIEDTGNQRIRRVGPDGNITTIAGNGTKGYGGDGGLATQAMLNLCCDNPTSPAVAIGKDGSIYIADNGNYRLRKVGTDGIINTIAGNGSCCGSLGDGGLAVQAEVEPSGVAVGKDGSIYIADYSSARVRRIGTDGIITSVAGGGGCSKGLGDGGSATQACLSYPAGVAVGQDGSIYIAEGVEVSRIRRVGPDGIITTVAGNVYGNNGYSGDGGPATQASLFCPTGVAVGQDGSIYIADSCNGRIRRVGPDGIISTVVGNGFSTDYIGGDGDPATQVKLNYPQGVAVDQDGSIYVSETYNSRVHRVAPLFPGFSGGDLAISSEDGSEIYIFNSNGRHLSTLDALTGAVRYNFTYDTADRLINVTDGDNNTLIIERDATGNATAIISPYGQRTNLALDANGYLASITDPAGESTQLTYTAGGLLTSLTDPKSNIHSFSYDTVGRLIRDADPAGGLKTLNRTNLADGYSVTLATGMNRNTTYLVEQLSTGDLLRVNTDPSGLKTTTAIGTNGSQISNYPDGTQINLLQGPDPRFGMQAPVPSSLTETTPGGLAQTITSSRSATLADPNNLLSLQTLSDSVSINGRTFTSNFDEATKNITRKTPMGRTGITTLDINSRIIESQVPGIIPVQFTYDTRGRLSNIAQGTRTYVLSYDPQGNLANITDPLSRSVGFAYDAAGRVTTQTLEDGRQIQYTYDANGNVVSITPPGRPNHAFNYTPVDLIENYTPPDVGIGPTSTLYTYNPDRQLIQITRPDGATINLGYDSAGRLSTITHPMGTTSMTYDSATGNLKNIIAPDGGTITYSYDGSLLTDTNWSGAISGSVHRTYDNNFSIASESVNGGNTVNFQYDMDGLLIQAGSLNLSRDPQNGLLTGTSIGNITDTIGYNSFGEVAAYQAAYSGASIFAVNYTRDDLGRIIQKNEILGGATHTYAYAYDLAGRLTNVSKDGVMISQYVYDANGNRLSYTNQSSTISGTYDNQDRLIQYGATTYNFTANGELLNKTTGSQTTTYQYDVLGNLRNVTLPDGTLIEYIIDGNNRRIGKKVNGILVQGFLYKNDPRPIAELDGSNNVISRFVYGSRINVPDYMIKGGTIYRIITDNLGSPRFVVDVATGTIVQHMDYDEFGNVILDTNPGFQPFGFAGGIYDKDTKLTRFGARDYDAQIGRWTTKDPILFLGGDTNLYGYVLNDPVNWVDSWGLYNEIMNMDPERPDPSDDAWSALDLLNQNNERLGALLQTEWNAEKLNKFAAKIPKGQCRYVDVYLDESGYIMFIELAGTPVMYETYTSMDFGLWKRKLDIKVLRIRIEGTRVPEESVIHEETLEILQRLLRENR